MNEQRPNELELSGTFRCDVCGRDYPHSHTDWEVEQERHCRPAFEDLMAYHTTDSDNLPVVIKPHRDIGPNSDYTRMLDAKLPDKWRWFSHGWYAAWKAGKGVTKPLLAPTIAEENTQ